MIERKREKKRHALYVLDRHHAPFQLFYEVMFTGDVSETLCDQQVGHRMT